MNYKRLFLAGATALLLSSAAVPLVGCSSDDDVVAENVNTDSLAEYGNPYSDSNWNALNEYFTVSPSEAVPYIVSEKRPKSGQSHRSSNNFNLEFKEPIEEHDYLYVRCDKNVSFNIKKDKTGTDPTWAEDVYDGYLIPLNGNEYNLYIADPSDAKANFSVSFFHVKPKNASNVFISSPGRPRRGQDHRGSYNFHLTGASRYQVICSDEKADFAVYYDKSGANDHGIAHHVKHGDFLNATSSSEKAWYLYEPTGTSGKPFFVVFTPVVTEWMKGISDDMPISQICMPGTHDTATGTLKPNWEGFGKCQNFVFTDQLDFGIRYFDLRVDGNLRLKHTYDCNNNLDEYFRWAIEFLKAHPSETILMQMTDLDGGMPGALKKMMEENPEFNDYSYRGTQVPRLGDVRGKIVFMRRFDKPDNADWGIDLKSIWPNNTTVKGITNKDGVKFCIEDYYFEYWSEWVHETGDKRDALNDALDYANAHPECVSLLFSSIAMGNVHTPWDYAWDSDPSMGDVVKDAVVRLRATTDEPIRSGMVFLMDYYSREGDDDYDHCVERIINLNYHKNSPVFDLSKLHSDRD